MQLIHIALDRLSVSPTNMRDGRKPPDIGDLLPSLRARGVLVPLLVRPAPDPDRFEIVAGRRRFFAARTLAEEGGAAEPLPCAIIAAGDDAAALEASLIENIARLAPHEVEQWEVFTRLVVKEHRQVDDIAATFGVEPVQVRRALALGNLLPKIREAYRAEAIDAATVRHLTLATKAQQRDWLALFADPDAYAPTGHQLKAWLFGGQPISTAHALFDVAAYTLGHIFEQSITELEILEAEADGRVSVNKESGRKTNGVYYTPEWVVERIVREALGGRLTEIKQECGWAVDNFGNATTGDVAAIDAYRERLQGVRVLDPACGSGAFLITALKYLLTEWRSILDLRRRVSGDAMTRDEDELIRDVLRTNLYGVDINPSSVEITQLAMWLHTARGDRPLSSLDAHIRDGNSLIDGNFWLGQQNLDLDEEGRERINTFDWAEAFPEAMADGGFDVVLGNPPYVKLQNFRKAHPDMAGYLRNGRPGTAFTGYRSAQSGNFDLYLPFIEKGIALLRPGGRLGYIAPSVWVMNEYGENLRTLGGSR